jgi:SAM-dependent methyltransferase
MKTTWDQRFAVPDYVYGTEPNAFVAAMAGEIPAGPVLCLAEGEGRNAVHLAQLGHAVTAVDQSAVGLAKAARLAAARGVPLTTVVADLASYAIAPAAWSGIVSTFAHLPPPLRRAVHANVVAGLRPGGVFILEAYTPAQLALGTGGPKDAELCLTLAGLRPELAGLEFVVARECERNVIEGTGHTGRGAVVQVVARRTDGSTHHDLG